MQFAQIGEVSLHVRVEGPAQGRTLAFSNSLGTDFRIWDAILPGLPDDVRMVRYDKRGHGLSDCPAGEWGMEEHIADLAGLLELAGTRGAVVVGLSVGGLIALGLAARRPELVSAIVLMDTAARIGTEAMWTERMDAIQAGGIGAISNGILERWFTGPFREENGAFPIYRNMLLRTPKDGYLKTCAAIRDTDFRTEARALRRPVLAMAGSEDGATPPDLVRNTADMIPGARYCEIPDAGHLPCVEQPGSVARLVRDFLQETRHD